MIAVRPTCLAMREMTSETSSLLAATLIRVLGIPTMDGCVGAILGGPPATPGWEPTTGSDDTGGSEGGGATVAPTW
jgi:hypothetical protein